MSSTIVEGCMFDSSSESQSEPDSESEWSTCEQVAKANTPSDEDEEEEIEVFSAGTQQNKSTSNNNQNQIGEHITLQTTLTRSSTTTTQNDGNGFGIQYKPLPVLKLEDFEVSVAVQDPPTCGDLASNNNDSVSDEEFTFADTADTNNIAAISKGIQSILQQQDDKQPDFSEYSMNQRHASSIFESSDSSNGFHFGAVPSIDEPLLLLQPATSGKQISQKFSNQQALKDIIDVYAAGMGDQEVLLLDDSDDHDKVLNTKVELSHDLTAISEEEEGEGEDETIINNPVVNSVNKPMSEWDFLEVSPSFNTDSVAPTITDMDYHQALKYFQSLNLSEYESSIVIVEASKSNSMFPFTAIPKLDFPNCNAQLKLPFLIACVDYDPFCHEHFSMLKEIFSFFVSEYYDALKLKPIDNHWEYLGFQGKDPRTDLNRSMKLLTILQMLHFMQSNATLAKYLFTLSQSWKPSASVTVGGFDSSWPFMCVSILFTKEAIQTLRSGALNAECNKRKDVLEVLHEYHHACFGEFCILLKREPMVHHANLLAKLRTLSASKPSKLLDHFRRKKYLQVSNTTSEKVHMESLSDLETITDQPSSNNETTRKWKNIFRSSKADKFSY